MRLTISIAKYVCLTDIRSGEEGGLLTNLKTACLLYMDCFLYMTTGSWGNLYSNQLLVFAVAVMLAPDGSVLQH